MPVLGGQKASRGRDACGGFAYLNNAELLYDAERADENVSGFVFYILAGSQTSRRDVQKARRRYFNGFGRGRGKKPWN